MMELSFEEKHRQRKRQAEMEIIIQKMVSFIKDSGGKRVLEFGTGDGYQIPYLKRLGNLTVSDIYKSEEIGRNYPDIEFVECDIRNTPFESESFDLIFSNHVLEHIKDIPGVFSELKRIGNSNCVYAFTIPTNIWLLLSIPAQCRNALQRMFNREPKSKTLKRKREGAAEVRGWRRFLPVGHGWRKNFFDCFNSFRIKNWQRLFREHGFTIMEKIPLLLYAPSEFPIVPTTRFLAGKGLCSSAIFILKKSDTKPKKDIPLKIGYLISNYFPSLGGAQVCIHHVANRVIDRGDKAVVITPARGGRDDKFFKYEIIRLNPLLNRLLFINFSFGKRYLERVLGRIQKRYDFDVWQVTIGYPLGAAAADFFNRNKIPCVLRCTGEDLQMLPEVGYGYRLQKRADALAKENYKKFTAVITAGDNTKKDYLLIEVPENKLHIVPNGVDCSKFAMEVNRKNIRNGLGLTENQKLILTVGRNHPKKGFKDIPLIIKRLLRSDIDFKWFLVGKGVENIKLLAEKEDLGKYLITEEVKAGFSDTGEPEIPNNKLIQYYKVADIFVFPTMMELFAKSIIEAMAAGLPIVTTDAPGVDDIIKDNENGLKSKAGDVEALAESILRLFSDRVLSQRLGENALRCSKDYDWSKITDSYLELYNRIIGFSKDHKA